jgi:hypothetical protein
MGQFCFEADNGVLEVGDFAVMSPGEAERTEKGRSKRFNNHAPVRPVSDVHAVGSAWVAPTCVVLRRRKVWGWRPSVGYPKRGALTGLLTQQ